MWQDERWFFFFWYVFFSSKKIIQFDRRKEEEKKPFVKKSLFSSGGVYKAVIASLPRFFFFSLLIHQGGKNTSGFRMSRVAFESYKRKQPRCGSEKAVTPCVCVSGLSRHQEPPIQSSRDARGLTHPLLGFSFPPI